MSVHAGLHRPVDGGPRGRDGAHPRIADRVPRRSCGASARLHADLGRRARPDRRGDHQSPASRTRSWRGATRPIDQPRSRGSPSRSGATARHFYRPIHSRVHLIRAAGGVPVLAHPGTRAAPSRSCRGDAFASSSTPGSSDSRWTIPRIDINAVAAPEAFAVRPRITSSSDYGTGKPNRLGEVPHGADVVHEDPRRQERRRCSRPPGSRAGLTLLDEQTADAPDRPSSIRGIRFAGASVDDDRLVVRAGARRWCRRPAVMGAIAARMSAAPRLVARRGEHRGGDEGHEPARGAGDVAGRARLGTAAGPGRAR